MRIKCCGIAKVSFLNHNILIMGGQQTKALVEHQNFKSSHPLFQNALTIKQGGKNYIQSRIPVQVKEYDAWKKKLIDTETPLNHQFLLLPEHTGFQHDKEMCSNTGTAINNYPYFPINLEEEIRRRQPDQALFKESELWYLLFALVTAKVDVRKHGGRVGDIKPANVFIDNERRAKIVNLFSSTRETSAFEKAKDFENSALNVLLAPQDLPEVAKHAIDNKSNVQSEIFSIGATVLSAGLLNDLKAAYNYKKLQFNSKAFQQIKDKWAEPSRYSQIFKSIVLNLVNESPQKRIKIEELYKFVAKYESSIKNKEQFIINHPPESLESGVSLVRSKVH